MKKVLIVCAIPHTKAWFKNMLESVYETNGAEKLGWASSALKESRYDMAIIDCYLVDEKMSGHDLASEVKKASPSTKVILFGQKVISSKADFFIQMDKRSPSKQNAIDLIKAVRFLFQK